MSEKRIIVKVQTSLYTSDGSATALVYNEDRSVMGEFPLSKKVAKAMDGESKKYFWAEAPKGGWIELFDEAPWQDW